MRIVTVTQFSKEPLDLLNTAQTERVLVTRNGKPVALLLGVQFKDQEDYALERDDEFWQLIAARRKANQTVPFDQVKRELLAPRAQTKKRTTRRPSVATKR